MPKIPYRVGTRVHSSRYAVHLGLLPSDVKPARFVRASHAIFRDILDLAGRSARAIDPKFPARRCEDNPSLNDLVRALRKALSRTLRRATAR